MKNLVARVLARPHKAVPMALAAMQLPPLRQHENPTVRALAEASWLALHGSYTAEDQRAVDAIEQLRARAAQSSEVVTVEDYGAGPRNALLSEEEMARGRVVQRSVGDICRAASKRPVEAALLWHLVRLFRPTRCVELGCSLGISGSYQARALQLNGDGGRLWTLEGAGALAAIATRHFAEQGLDNVEAVVGRFQDTLDGVLSTHAPIDYAFIDGHHDEKATIAYCEQILPHCAPRALLVFDDIRWSDGMRRAWAQVASDPRMPISFDCGEVGVCALDPDVKQPVRARAVVG